MHSIFTWNIRVYYEDTDAGGIVFYANYLKYFERARTEWLRAAGINQHQLTEELGVVFVVKSAAVEYHAPARLDDELQVSVAVRRFGQASLTMHQEVRHCGARGKLLADAIVKLGCIDAKTFRPCAIPEAVVSKMSQTR